MNDAPSMAALARAAGVAKSTVSMALRDDSRISAEQRLRIQKLAEEMGYRTNALVSRLMCELRKARDQRYVATLAVINASKNPHLQQTNSQTRVLLNGIEHRAEQLGYSLDYFWLFDPEMQPERLARIMQARNIQGGIFLGIANERCLKKSEAIWNNIPSITVGSHLKSPALNFVMIDLHYAAMQTCIQLRRAGYRRIGIVLDRWLDNVMEHRLVAGYLASYREDEARPPILYLDDKKENERQEGKRRFAQWVEKYRLDACICINAFILDWVREMGIDIPGEMGVALLDLPSELQGTVAGMDSRQDRAGAVVIDNLITQINRGESGVPVFQHGTLIQGQWSPGPTVKKWKVSAFLEQEPSEALSVA